MPDLFERLNAAQSRVHVLERDLAAMTAERDEYRRHYDDLMATMTQAFEDNSQLRAALDALDALKAAPRYRSPVMDGFVRGMALGDDVDAPHGWCVTHDHPMSYTTEDGGYAYCDRAKPTWPTPPMHPTRRDDEMPRGES